MYFVIWCVCVFAIYSITMKRSKGLLAFDLHAIELTHAYATALIEDKSIDAKLKTRWTEFYDIQQAMSKKRGYFDVFKFSKKDFDDFYPNLEPLLRERIELIRKGQKKPIEV